MATSVTSQFLSRHWSSETVLRHSAGGIGTCMRTCQCVCTWYISLQCICASNRGRELHYIPVQTYL